MDLQSFIDAKNREWRDERSSSQMTLGTLISELENRPMSQQIESIGEPHSYRGYYEDLAFEKNGGLITVAELLEILNTRCIGQTFTGYKGGDFYMDANTPIWIAGYGSCGDKIIAIEEGETFSFTTEEDN